MGLATGYVGRNLTKLFVINYPRATPFHLLKEICTLDSTHEDQDLQGLDIGASRDHIYSYSNTRIVIIAKFGDQLFWLTSRSSIGDLLGKFVALTKLIEQDIDNIICMAIILGKDQRFGHICT